MRTRTLLLLAVACGLLILGAGVVQLLRIAGQDDPPVAAAVGEPVRIGDMTVTIDDVDEFGLAMVVAVTLGGVDDPDGSEAFRLVVPGAALVAGENPAIDGQGGCAATTVEPQRCTLTFDLRDVDGSSRVLLYRRGDEQARWELGSRPGP